LICMQRDGGFAMKALDPRHGSMEKLDKFDNTPNARS